MRWAQALVEEAQKRWHENEDYLFGVDRAALQRTLFPLATARDVPVVAFTTTRWNSLQKEPAPDGWTEGAPPTTAECMRWALAADDAVEVVLNSAPTTETLGAWCEDWAARGDGVAMGADEVAKWRRYGELVYEEDAPFETYT